jgi:hypothetical protein
MSLADQSLNPNKYIEAKLTVVKPAQVAVRLTNLAAAPVNNVQLKVSNGETTHPIFWTESINPGKSVIVRSQYKIGRSQTVNQMFEVRIVSSTIAD